MNKDLVPSIHGARCQMTPRKEETLISEDAPTSEEFIGDEELAELQHRFERA